MSAQVFDLARHRESRHEPLPAEPGEGYDPVFADTAALLQAQLDKLPGAWPDTVALWIGLLAAADRLERAAAALNP